jgi:hypothetical protein
VTLLLAHHELAASVGAYALGLSGATVAVLWRLAAAPLLGRLRRRPEREPGPDPAGPSSHAP